MADPLSHTAPRSSRTRLSPEEEQRFQVWYRAWARHLGIDPDPDHPDHRYDYRGAFKAGENPGWDDESREFHWPSAFKDDDHPTRFKGGRDTRTGEPVPQGHDTPGPLLRRRREREAAGVPSTPEGEIPPFEREQPVPIPAPTLREGGPSFREGDPLPPVLTPSPGIPFRPIAPETPRIGEQAGLPRPVMSLREYLMRRQSEAAA